MNHSCITDEKKEIVDEFECVIIGAGVAGGLSAFLLAQAGRRVLIVDAKPFPRKKVCGCCLNQRAQRVLQATGLSERFDPQKSCSIDTMQLFLPGTSYSWTVPTIQTIERSLFDTYLVDAAIELGATFYENTRATVLTDRTDSNGLARIVELRQANLPARFVSTRLVIAADGLTQSSLSKLPEFDSKVSPRSRIGLQATIPRGSVPNEIQHALAMITSARGYVGVAPVDPTTSNIAAAVDPMCFVVKDQSPQRPWQIVDHLLRKNKLIIDENVLLDAEWRATPPLTRRSTRSASHRILLVGDSLGYVEPFTGEGMSWAMAGAVLLQPLARAAIDSWSDKIPGVWQQKVQSELIRKQWLCRQLSSLLRSPRRARLAASLCQRLPPVRNWALQKVSTG